MTGLTPQAHAALSAEFKALQAENDQLKEAMKGATVIADHAGEIITALHVKIEKLVLASEQYLNVMSDPQSGAEKGYISPARNALIDAIALARGT